MICLTWNIEGFSRNISDLKKITATHDPSLIFISEPWLFQHDIPQVENIFSEYMCILNSDDKYDEDIPLKSTRAHGGVLTLIKKSLEPFISEIESGSCLLYTSDAADE